MNLDPMHGGMKHYFRKQHRLQNRGDFQEVFNTSDLKLSRKYFALFVRKTKDVTPRLGMVISRRKLKHAVNRNWCKRIVRESFRQHQAYLQGVDIIFLARSGVAALTRKELHDQLVYQWNVVQKRLLK